MEKGNGKKGVGSEINILLSVYRTVIAVVLRGYHAYYLCLCFTVFYEGLVYVKQCTVFEPQMTVGCMYGRASCSLSLGKKIGL